MFSEMMNIRAFLIFSVLAFVCLGCQTERSELLTTQEDNTEITTETETILRQIALNDGSADNIIDGASCLEIALPITVIVNNNPVTINTITDLEIVELLIEERVDDEDVITIDFPIEITLENHSKVAVESLDGLRTLAADCNGENEEDEDIEGVDLRYPISFPVFDQVTTDADVRTVQNDAQLYDFITNIGDDEVIGLEFPVMLIRPDSTMIEVTGYEAFEATVRVLDDGYDEDDDTDFNDDDTVTISEQDFIDTITQCGYVIESLVIDDVTLESTFDSYHFEFYEYQNIVTACIGNILYSGSWEVTTVNDNIRLAIDFVDLEHINRNWIVHEFVNDQGIVNFSLRLGEDILDFNMDCIDQTPDVIALLSNGDWKVYLFVVDNINVTNEYQDYLLNFDQNGSVAILDTAIQEITDGTWDVQNFGLELGLDFGQTDPLFNFNNEDWHIDYYDSNEIHLYDFNTENFLLLEKL